MTISVVIPALDEADHVADAIASVVEGALATPDRSRAPSQAPPRDAGAVEVCVVDGGSRDETVARARSAAHPAVPLQVIRLDAPDRGDPDRGDPDGDSALVGRRARQLQLGFEATRGDTVLFLHADTRLPPGWVAAVERSLSSPDVVGGAFRFGFREVAPRPGRVQRIALACVAAGARLRARLFGLPYGDQAIFARRAVLAGLGGVPAVRLMEDLDLVRALKQKGRLVILPETATTSPRRHLDGGVARIAARHALAAAAWAVGVDRDRLARWLGR